MLENSDNRIPDVLKVFTKFGVNVSFLSPTVTNLEKSILDAIAPLRRFLRENNIHNYENQSQGEENKKTAKAFFVENNSMIETLVSFYRPNTKMGDPRIWFYGLKAYSRPNNLLAILVFDHTVYIVNTSNPEILNSLDIIGSPLNTLVANISKNVTPASVELLSMLRTVSARGFVKSQYKGDTSIGIMLASELGIPRYDMSKGPDYKGIEIKGHRKKGKKGNKTSRTTIFSQVPDWDISKNKSTLDILNNHGYYSETDKRIQLNVTVRAHLPNQQGLFLEFDFENDWLKNLCKRDDQVVQDVVNWRMQTLRNRLKEKHPETFFVGADVQTIDGNEYFHYVDAEYTRGPLINNLEYCIDEMKFTMDFVMHMKPDGASRDHGYLFKMHQVDFDLLFPRIEHYDLTRLNSNVHCQEKVAEIVWLHNEDGQLKLF